MRLAVAVVLPVLTLLVTSSAQTTKSGDAWARFQEAKWSTVRKLDQVPIDVLTALRPHLGDNPVLADSGAPFDPTGTRPNEAPRRLVLAGHSRTDWFILYDQGGPNRHLVFVDFELTPEPQPVLLATGTAGIPDPKFGWRVDLHGLTKALQSGTMHWGKADAPTY